MAVLDEASLSVLRETIVNIRHNYCPYRGRPELARFKNSPHRPLEHGHGIRIVRAYAVDHTGYVYIAVGRHRKGTKEGTRASMAVNMGMLVVRPVGCVPLARTGGSMPLFSVVILWVRPSARDSSTYASMRPSCSWRWLLDASGSDFTSAAVAWSSLLLLKRLG
jgi:hypothetical protein